MGKTRYRAEACYTGTLHEAFGRLQDVFGFSLWTACSIDKKSAKRTHIIPSQVVRIGCIPEVRAREVFLFPIFVLLEGGPET